MTEESDIRSKHATNSMTHASVALIMVLPEMERDHSIAKVLRSFPEIPRERAEELLMEHDGHLRKTLKAAANEGGSTKYLVIESQMGRQREEEIEYQVCSQHAMHSMRQ